MASACKWGVACAVLVVIGATAMQGVLSPAAAQGQSVARRAKAMATPYYIEFRAADVGVYGHSYIVFGRLGPGGRPVTAQYADFHPEGGMLGLAVGHAVPVAADMTPEKETLTLPISSSFRRPITAAQYATVIATINRVHANNHVWSALAYNCNTFVGDVAASIGMTTPTSLLFSTSYIPALHWLNETPAEAAAQASPTETTATPVRMRHTRHRPSTGASAAPAVGHLAGATRTAVSY